MISGKNKKIINHELASQEFDFLYDQRSGSLYFNQNGSDKGFGDGGIIALLKEGPDLHAKDVLFI